MMTLKDYLEEFIKRYEMKNAYAYVHDVWEKTVFIHIEHDDGVIQFPFRLIEKNKERIAYFAPPCLEELREQDEKLVSVIENLAEKCEVQIFMEEDICKQIKNTVQKHVGNLAEMLLHRNLSPECEEETRYQISCISMELDNLLKVEAFVTKQLDEFQRERMKKEKTEAYWISDRLPDAVDITKNGCAYFLTSEKYQSFPQRRRFDVVGNSFIDTSGEKINRVYAWAFLPKMYRPEGENNE